MNERRLTIVLLCLSAVVAAGLSGYYGWMSWHTPEFVGDVEQMQRALDAVKYGDSKTWFAVQDPFLTKKWAYADLAEGWGVMAFSLFSMAIFTARKSTVSRFLETPKTFMAVCALIVGTAILQLFYSAFYFSREVQERHCCAIWGDTAGLPVGATTILSAFLAIILIVWLAPFFWRSNLPHPLFPTGVGVSRQMIWSLAAAPLIAGSILLIVMGTNGYSAAIPFGLVGGWAALVGRAAALGRSQRMVPA